MTQDKKDELAFWQWQAAYHRAALLLPYDRRYDVPTPAEVKGAFDQLSRKMEEEKGDEDCWPYAPFPDEK